MKFLLLATIIALLLVVDGTLAYDPFDWRNYSFGDLLGLLLGLFIVCFIAWAEHTKKNKHGCIRR